MFSVCSYLIKNLSRYIVSLITINYYLRLFVSNLAAFSALLPIGKKKKEIAFLPRLCWRFCQTLAGMLIFSNWAALSVLLPIGQMSIVCHGLAGIEIF